MLERVPDPDNGRVQVTFRLPAAAGAEQAWVAGEFNDWSTEAAPLQRADDGSLFVVLPLEAGRSYRFRYYLGDHRWENDWAADAYVDNEYGGSDSVVELDAAQGRIDLSDELAATEPPPSVEAAAAAPAKPAGAPRKAATKPTASRANGDSRPKRSRAKKATDGA